MTRLPVVFVTRGLPTAHEAVETPLRFCEGANNSVPLTMGAKTENEGGLGPLHGFYIKHN
jgi:hypothetical protein